jgi:uncharacterized membrane protein
MEGDFKSANDAIGIANQGGYNTTEAKNYVDGERLWKASLEKEKIEKAKAAQAKVEEQKKEELAGATPKAGGAIEPVVLYDRHRGGYVEKEVTAALVKSGLKTKDATAAITDEDLAKCVVLLVRDPGETGSYVPPYTEEDIKRVAAFVNSGGGLVFIGARRVTGGTRGTAFDPLLAQFKVAVKNDRLKINPDAPKGHPHGYAPGLPGNHPICQGIEQVPFSLTTPLIVAPPQSWVVASSKFVSSSATNQSPVPFVVAGTFNGGRLVVFAEMPSIWDEERGMEGIRLVVNAVRWAAQPRMQQAPAPAAK